MQGYPTIINGFVYILIVFLSIRLLVVLFNLYYLPHLSSLPKSDQLPFVSILIPVKNEERNIIKLLESIIYQDYTNYEVIILDDGSTDQTFSLLERYCTQYPSIRLVKGLPLAHGWLGKNFGCHQLANLAIGDYLLFLDADVRIKSGLLSKTLKRMQVESLSLLSLFADQELKLWGEWLTVPLMNYFLLSFLPLSLVKGSSKESLSAANGQFMLFPRSSYLKYQWHEKVKDKIAEDYEICKLIKKNKLFAETLLGDGYFTCRMYSGLIEGIEGFTKNTYALFNYNLGAILGFVFMILFIYGGQFIHFSLGITSLILILILSIRIGTSFLSRQNIVKNILLHPFQIGMMVYISILSVVKYKSGKVYWKGRLIQNI